MRINKVRVVPPRARFGNLLYVDLARRNQHLLNLARAIGFLHPIAIHIAIRKDVVGPQSLNLGDGVVKRLPIPQAHIIEQRTVLQGRAGRLRRRTLGAKVDFLQLPGQAVSGPRARQVAFDVRPLNGDLARLHVERVDQPRQHQRYDIKRP